MPAPGSPRIYLSNSLDFPSGLSLHPRTEVRFVPDPSQPDAYIDLYMPTTRDQGWIQVTTSPFHSVLLSQHNSGLFLCAAASAPAPPRAPGVIQPAVHDPAAEARGSNSGRRIRNV
jgi:hypothetical protein